MATVVARYGTGYLRTTVLHTGEGDYLWIRRPGPDRRDPLGRPDATTRPVIAATRPDAPVTLALPEPDAPWAGQSSVAYRAHGPSSLAGLLLRPREGTQATAAAALHAMAGALAGLHEHGAPAAGRLTGPPGPRRLLRWLRTGAGSRMASRLHPHAGSVLGRRRLSAMEAWCAELGATAGPGRRGGEVSLLHGAPGGGSLVPAPDQGTGHLLTGENLAAGPPASDLGWLVGELVELRELAAHRGTGESGPDHDGLITAFLSGYGREVDRAAVGRAAALRFLTHLHDFSAYVGWDGSLVDELPILTGVIDAAEQATLLPVPPEMCPR